MVVPLQEPRASYHGFCQTCQSGPCSVVLEGQVAVHDPWMVVQGGGGGCG